MTIASPENIAPVTTDTIRLTAVPEFRGLEMIRARMTARSFAPHFHDTFLIGVTEVGAEVFRSRSGPKISPTGSIRFHNPEDIHDGGPHGAVWAYRAIYPTVDFLDELARECGLPPRPAFSNPIGSEPRLARRLLRLFSALEESPSSIARETLVVDVLGEVLERHAYGGLEKAPTTASLGRELVRARDHLRENACVNVRLSDVAAIAGVNRWQLVRGFKAALGITPVAYHAQCRLGQARKFLKKGLRPGIVARHCGYYDASHFSHAFLASMGVTPIAYWALHR